MSATRERLAGVGAFVIVGFVLFAIAVFMIGDRQMAFGRRVSIYTEFTTITGLAARRHRPGIGRPGRVDSGD